MSNVLEGGLGLVGDFEAGEHNWGPAMNENLDKLNHRPFTVFEGFANTLEDLPSMKNEYDAWAMTDGTIRVWLNNEWRLGDNDPRGYNYWCAGDGKLYRYELGDGIPGEWVASDFTDKADTNMAIENLRLSTLVTDPELAAVANHYCMRFIPAKPDGVAPDESSVTWNVETEAGVTAYKTNAEKDTFISSKFEVVHTGTYGDTAESFQLLRYIGTDLMSIKSTMLVGGKPVQVNRPTHMLMSGWNHETNKSTIPGVTLFKGILDVVWDFNPSNTANQPGTIFLKPPASAAP